MDQEIRATLLGLVTALIGLIALYYPEQRITIKKTLSVPHTLVCGLLVFWMSSKSLDFE